jgi:hypothetical protein
MVLWICRYANDENFYMAMVNSVTETGTVMVTYEGFEEQDEVGELEHVVLTPISTKVKSV